MDNIPMISPYQVSPPQGNLIGSIMDFIGQNRQMQLDAGTRGFLGGQMGLPGNVDPFGVQKFEGEGQRQMIAGDTNTRANEEQGWQRGDRQAIGGLAGQLGQNPMIAGDPLLSALAGAGANPAVMSSLLGMLGGDRSNQQAQQNWGTQFGMTGAANTAQNALEHEYRMKEIEAQMSGKNTGRMTDSQKAARRMDYVEGRIGREQLIAEGLWDTDMEQARADGVHNQKTKQETEAAEAIKKQIAGTNPQAAAQKAAPTVIPPAPGAYPPAETRPVNSIADWIRNLLISTPEEDAYYKKQYGDLGPTYNPDRIGF